MSNNLAMQQMRNIVASVEKYAYDALVTTDKLNVGFYGVPFESRGLASWLQMTFLESFPRSRYRSVGEGFHGSEQRIILQISCFARTHSVTTGAPANRNALYDLRDKVANRFPIGKIIDVKDHVKSGTTTVGTILIADMNEQAMAKARTTSTAADLDSGLNSWVFTIILRYVHPHKTT